MMDYYIPPESAFYQDIGFSFNHDKGECMLLTVFAIYDSGISTWMPPIYARNKGEMLRQFMDACNDPGSKLAKHPQDYTLFEIGTFDDDKCIFNLHKTPVRLVMAIDVLKNAPAASGGGAGGTSPREERSDGSSSGTK